VPDEVRVSRSLRATLRKGAFEVRLDTAFDEVVTACASIPRKHEEGTWISPQIRRAYGVLHQLGFAHSIETWSTDDGALVGGLYGVSIGRTFFGESMFAARPDASKVALVGLASACRERGIPFVDCQVRTDHLASMGAREMPRAEFLAAIRRLVHEPPGPEPWAGPTIPTVELLP
jgi:leucyl/phenylalanyl-tRNA--protein transferase